MDLKSEVGSVTSSDRKNIIKDYKPVKKSQNKIDYLKLDGNVILEEPDREGSS